MAKRILLFVAALLCARGAAAAETGFKKDYFAETKPGAFARYKSTDEKGGVSQLTYVRLPDVGEDRWLELRYEVLSGQYKGTNSVTGCLVPAAFPLEKDAIDFQVHARRCAAASGGSPATEYPAATMKAIAEGAMNYAPLVAFKGTETVAGKAADRYGYSYKTSYMNIPATTTGDVWVSEGVPFGVVKDTMAIRDAKGKVLATVDQVLVETGKETRTALTGWSWGRTAEGRTAAAGRSGPQGRSVGGDQLSASASASSPTSSSTKAATSSTSRSAATGSGLTLPQAFEKELVRMTCTVVAGSNGSRLRVTLSNKSERPVKVTLTRAPMTFAVGTPLETLVLAADDDRTVEIAADDEAPTLEMAQRGDRRVTSGRFTVSRYEGTPLFQGSVEVGSAHR